MSYAMRMQIAHTTVSGRAGDLASGGLGFTTITTTTTMPFGAGNG